MKKLYSATQSLAKILEVCHWVATGFLLVLLILTLLPGDLYSSMVFQSSPHDVTVETYGFEMTVADAAGFDKGCLRVFAPGAALIMALMAMVCRNIYLILKTSKGQTWFAQGETPFQKDVTRMVREIGYFLLGTVAVSLLFSVIGTVALGVDKVESSLNLTGIMVGLLMLCLSQVFEQGARLQQDVDGLL